MIYTNQTSKKTRRQVAKEEAAWKAQCARDGLLPTGKKFVPLQAQPSRIIRDEAFEFKNKQSLNTTVGNAFKPADKVYTGTNMIGICQMAKSNAVPVFSQQEIIDISKMRRG